MFIDHELGCNCESCCRPSTSNLWSIFERKCREIRESPSMMWKRSIVQGCGRRRPEMSSVLALTIALLAILWTSEAADLVIEIPGSGGVGEYRLDYRPPHGFPTPNFTVQARASTINFQGLPGTKYHFMLYYSNDTLTDLLTWNQTIITAPEPPTNLTVTLGRNKQAAIAWSPPAHGDYTGFRFKVIPLTERAEGGARNITVEGGNWTHALRDLSPGATYQLHAFTLLHDKESAAYASRNFTTKPNTPGKFIVWFRNETTLLVLWQPPYPPGFYTHYKVSIVPADARESELYVEKEGEPPGPAQAAFKGLVPGRAYNISVQTVSEPEISAPTTAQYRTVPLRPRNVTAPDELLGETAFTVTWLPPAEESEFEKYQISVSGESRRLPAVVRAREDAPAAEFDALEPGAHYTVTVKTMSGKVTSWPATAELTLKPLPVVDLVVDRTEGGLSVTWRGAVGSNQDEYRVSYHEGRDDSSTLVTAGTNITLASLLPGRNYTVSVRAVSRGHESNETIASAVTRPLAPVVVEAAAGDHSLRLTWRSDVTSRQDRYRLRYARLQPEPRDWHTLETEERSVELEGLFPGAVYEVQVAALAHGLLSDNHTLLKPVRPLPARSMSVQRATSSSVSVEWAGPARAASAVGRYTLRYRTLAAPAWHALPPIPPTAQRAEIANLTYGERYIIELDTGSEVAGGEDGEVAGSGTWRRAEHTVPPAPVSNVAQLADTRNVTLEWPRPAGRVEQYLVRWWSPERAASVADPGPGAASVRALLPGLDPGRPYSIAITALSYNLTSDHFTMDTRTRPLIQSEMTIVNEARNGDGEEDSAPPSILVTYTPTPASATVFDSYRFRLEPGEAAGQGSGAQEASRNATEPARRVLFADLTPGALYNVTMVTVSSNVTSHPVQRQVRLFPRPVTELRADRVGAREVSLSWTAPSGVWTDFEVQYLAAADTLRTLTAARAALAVAALRAHTQYNFTVVVRAGAAGALRTVSAPRSVAVRTDQAPPGAPGAFHPADAAPSRLEFVWELPPDQVNGVLQRFELAYWPQDKPDNVTTIEFPPDARSGAVSALSPGASYEFSLRGVTAAARRRRAARARRRLAHHRRRALPRRLLFARQRQRHRLHARAGRGAARRHAGAPALLARRAAPAALAALPGDGAVLPVPRGRAPRGGVHHRLGEMRGGGRGPRLLQRAPQAGDQVLCQAARLHRAGQVHGYCLHRSAY